ncbi:MAG: hypothetical protein HW413_652 [Thermoleophilia bacterium]|nr:hypothetical protein [Thermoleophilia bacterium]
MTTGQLQGDRPVQEEAAVELVAARDAANAAAEADKAARRAAAAAENSARQAAKQAARAEKAAKSLGRRRRRRWRVGRWFPAHPSMGEPVEPEIATFPDLVRAHRAWEQELYEHELHEHERPNRQPDKAIEREFRRRWRQFEARFGRIDDAYWSVRDASAVALTIRQKHSRWRPDPELIPRFHRATDWATRDEPEIAEGLDDCEMLAVRVEEILRGPSELIALRRINAVASHLLGFVDREWGRRPPPAAGQRTPDMVHQEDPKAFVERQRKELERVERFYKRTGNGQARILFFWGMAQGLLALVLLTGLAVALTGLVDGLDGGGTHWGELQLFVISVMAGALGALLSVLTRMASLTGKFVLDHEVGRKNVRWIGIYRPFVGGIFGVATYLMLASGILQTQSPVNEKDFAYYGILALFSGFFERFTTLKAGGVPTPLEDEGAAKKDEEERDKTQG